MKGFNFIYTLVAIIVMMLILLYFVRYFNLDLRPAKEDHEELPDTIIYSISDPQVTEQQLLDYLQGKVGTRLRGRESDFFTLGKLHDIDPAFAVAVSEVETSLGKAVCKGVRRNCNNFFCITYDAVKFRELSKGKCGETEWANFETSEKGIEAFFIYINERYVENQPSQDSISKIGCGPGSGFDINCYCGMTGTDCESWVTQVTELTDRIRAHQA